MKGEVVRVDYVVCLYVYVILSWVYEYVMIFLYDMIELDCFLLSGFEG